MTLHNPNHRNLVVFSLGISFSLIYIDVDTLAYMTLLLVGRARTQSMKEENRAAQ
jgi:hypothetical protein